MATKKQAKSKSPLGRAEFARGAIDGPNRAKLTKELQHQICTYLRLGAPVSIALRVAGVSDTLWGQWRARAAKHDASPDEHRSLVWYSILCAEVEKAKAEGAFIMHRVLRTGQPQTFTDKDGNPVAFTPERGDLRWLLERVYRKEYGVMAPSSADEAKGDGRMTVNLILKDEATDSGGDEPLPEPAGDEGDPPDSTR